MTDDTRDPAAPIKVLLVDNDPMVVQGVQMIVESADDLHVVGSASDGDEVVEQVQRHSPDVVLLDVRMPRMSGVEATRRLQAQPNPPRVVMLTTFNDDSLVVEAISAGAAGYLLKTADPHEVIAAVRRVAAGASVISPESAGHLFAHLADDGARQGQTHAREALARLTDREFDVAMAVAREYGNAEIGRELHLSEATVKTHLAAAQHKLGVAGRVGVAMVVARAGQVVR